MGVNSAEKVYKLGRLRRTPDMVARVIAVLWLALPAVAGVDACLITPAEAEAVLRVPVGVERPHRGYRGAEVCWYVAPTDQSLRFELHAGGRGAYEAYLKKFEPVSGQKPRPVRNVGHEAVFHAGQLTVLYRQYFFVIAIGSEMQDRDRLEASIGLARKVTFRLQHLGPAQSISPSR